MKSGTGDDPFASDDDESESTEPSDADSQSSPTRRTDSDRDAGDSALEHAEIPYVYRRDTVKEGRDQIPIFLRDHVQEGERDLIRDLEDDLGEDVSKTDAREAAMVVAQRHPDLVAGVLREWGYDYE